MHARRQKILNKVFFISKIQTYSPKALPGLLPRNIGKHGEELALVFLQEKGMACLNKNWKCRLGEIDLIMQDKQDIVFVEVKSRCLNSKHNYDVFANITPHKAKRLRLLVDVFQAQHKSKKTPIKTFQLKPRIDLVGIIFETDGKTVRSIEHLVSAV